METFNDNITALRQYIAGKSADGRQVRSLDCNADPGKWAAYSKKKSSSIVLKEDTWVELGNPATFSMAPVLVTERLDLVNDGAITLIGPDISELRGSVPFAQILLIASTQLNDEDYRKLNTAQYELALNGYMIKALPSALTIRSRVSKNSVKAGFSFSTLGSDIIKNYKSRFPAESAEVLFITSSEKDIQELKDLHTKVVNIIKAMNKMMEEMSFDCSSCEYVDVCDDVQELGALREKLKKSK